MRLTPEEYQQGIVTWNTESPCSIRTRTASNAEEPSDWSAALTDASGSLSTSPARAKGEIRVDNIAPEATIPFPIFWEILDSRGIGTSTTVFDVEGSVTTRQKLLYVPRFGIFHRIVLAPRENFHWEHDAIVRSDWVTMRLHTGSIQREEIAPIVYSESNGPPGLSIGPSQTIIDKGRFVEITAQGDSPDSAKARAHAALGLLGLTLGQAVIGQVLSEETYESRPGELQRGLYEFRDEVGLPQVVDEFGLDAADRVLETLTTSSMLNDSYLLALQWFERSTYATSHVDRFLGLYVAIEAIVNAHADQQGPIPKIRERKSRYRAVLRTCFKQLDVDEVTRMRLLDSLAYASSRDKFEFFVERTGLAEEWQGIFNRLSTKRNELFHGHVGSISSRETWDARQLLVAILKKQFEIEGKLQSELTTPVQDVTLSYLLALHETEGPF
jgi:hypothetical protein